MGAERRETDTLILSEIKEIRDLLNTFKIEFREYKTKVEIILLGPDGQDGLCSKILEHDIEIHKIKNWHSKIMGAVIAISTIIGLFFKALQ